MRKIIQTLLAGTIFALGMFFFINQQSVVLAQSCQSGYTCSGGCTRIGQCVNGKTCVNIHDPRSPMPSKNISPAGPACGGGTGQAIFGRVVTPISILRYNYESATGQNSIGILAFANTLIILFFSICVIWFMFNLFYVGYQYIANPSETKSVDKLKEALFYPVIGMIVLASAFLLASLIGSFFFGDANFILQPTLPSVLDK